MNETGFLLILVLFVFYLYLLARFQYVKRPAFFLLGALGLAVSFAGRFFGVGGNPGHSIMIVVRILDVVGLVVGFLMVVAACFGGALPGKLSDLEKKVEDAAE